MFLLLHPGISSDGPIQIFDHGRGIEARTRFPFETRAPFKCLPSAFT